METTTVRYIEGGFMNGVDLGGEVKGYFNGAGCLLFPKDCKIKVFSGKNKINIGEEENE